MNKYLETINIIVPTRKGIETLKFTINSILSDHYPKLLIHVIDNKSSDGTLSYLKTIRDKRFKYYQPASHLSMSENWEFGLSKIKDGYVTILGSDDGHFPSSAYKLNSILKNYNYPDAIMSKPCFYKWPQDDMNKTSRLEIPTTTKLEWRETKTWLKKFMNGFVDIAELPTLYTGGYIKTSIINKIIKKSKKKKFYHSSIPDVYSAVAISLTTEKYLYCHEPLAISGISKFSNGVSAEKLETNKSGSPANLFNNENKIPYHKNILLNNGFFPQLVHAYRLESFFQTEFLRKKPYQYEKNFWEKHFIILLSEALMEDKLNYLSNWFDKYMNDKNLNFKKLRRYSNYYYLLIKFKNLKRSFNDNLFSEVFYFRDHICDDIYKASIVAEAIKQKRNKNFISKFFSWLKKLVPAIKKVFIVR